MSQDPSNAAPDVRVLRDGPILRVTLNRPDKRNALSRGMVRTLIDSLIDAVNGDEVRVIVLTAAGDHFCSGVDLTEANAPGPDGKPQKPRIGHLQRGMQYGAHYLIKVMFELQLPIVAGVRGWAAGIGNSLALASDHVIAAHGAKFWTPFVTKGFTPDSGSTWLLPRLVGLSRAKEMIMRGRPIEAAQAASWGLINEVVEDAGLDAAVDAVASEYARAATFAVGYAKVLTHKALEAELDAALRAEAMGEELSLRGDDFKEGLKAFRERRDPNYQGR
ncbi:MAG: enoyl-CoA hydratase/isomerase family protein [Gammaproteobacteria bacterium]